MGSCRFEWAAAAAVPAHQNSNILPGTNSYEFRTRSNIYTAVYVIIDETRSAHNEASVVHQELNSYTHQPVKMASPGSNKYMTIVKAGPDEVLVEYFLC